MRRSVLTISILFISNFAFASTCLVEHKSEPVSVKLIKVINFNEHGIASNVDAKNIDKRAINSINRKLRHNQDKHICWAIVKTGDISHKEFSAFSHSEIFVYIPKTECPTVNTIINGSILLSCNVKYQFQVGDTSDGYSHYSTR